MSGEDLHVLEPANALYAYTGAFVDELCRAGIHHAVVCPGSRSTPLALALVQHSGIRVWIHIDERSAAFFALGMAKGLYQPVALLCTSGTAAANFYPAVIEAKLSQVPLVVLTADRPHELRDCGAPQAIDQNRLYGHHVKWYMEAAPALATNESLRYIRTLADRATATAAAVPAGPVHLNFPISDPMTPEPGPLMPAPLREAAAWTGRSGGAAYTVVNDVQPATPALEKLTELTELLSSSRRGLIIAGPQPDPGLAEPLTRLARSLGYPLLADPLSQLRVPPEDASSAHQTILVTAYDAFLRSESELAEARSAADHYNDDEEEFAPDVILRFGAMPTSKALLLYLQHHAHRCPLIVISSTGSWDEPTQLASEMIHADPVAFCNSLASLLAAHPTASATNRSVSTWGQRWQATDLLTRRTLGDAVADLPELFEGRVFTELARLLPADSILFGGNSMPVRDMGTFFWGNKPRIQIFGNRGANGIDGVVSSALGMSAARSQSLAPSSGKIAGRAVLVIGDLSFYHDSNGLLAAFLHRLDLTIILVNNDGGGIFSFLPQSAYPEHFEQLFGTPTGLDFQPLVKTYGGHFERIQNWSDFELALLKSWQIGGLWVIEVTTNRSTNVLMHRQLRQRVRQELQKSRIAPAAPLPVETS